MIKYINKDNISIIYRFYKQESNWIYYPQRTTTSFFGFFTTIEEEELRYCGSSLRSTTDFSKFIIENNIAYDRPKIQIHLNSGDKHTIWFDSDEKLDQYINENPWILLNLNKL